MGPGGPHSEYTVCGFAFDGTPSVHGEMVDRLRPTGGKVVTCPRCIEIINVCKRVKVRCEDPQMEKSK